jgi:hypothetical protein
MYVLLVIRLLLQIILEKNKVVKYPNNQIF